MKFFVPRAEGLDAERIYSDLASVAGSAPLPADRRIWRIQFDHNGDHWTAEVGKELFGERVEVKRRKSGKVTMRTALSDPAIVLAIFPGTPFRVVTHAAPLGDVRSYWCNPFFAGQPRSVEHFEQPER